MRCVLGLSLEEYNCMLVGNFIDLTMCHAIAMGAKMKPMEGQPDDDSMIPAW